MNKILSPLLGLLLLSSAIDAQPVNELDPKAAVKLIASLNDMAETPIAIASIISGTKTDGKFEASHVRRVTAIHPVSEDGSKVRRVRCYDFHWNETYGWFVFEKRAGRGGDEVWIWSENSGELEIR
ncbi:hypothetical protein ACFQY0_03430 [Haloferula chungangensis]|uniref:Uncharacterized protein n=1 Tax=Haloferula chungangensis TaxID=1048331 RepID=A0ABW2L506_9BACT